jgi:hypothetical protein
MSVKSKGSVSMRPDVGTIERMDGTESRVVTIKLDEDPPYT